MGAPEFTMCLTVAVRMVMNLFECHFAKWRPEGLIVYNDYGAMNGFDHGPLGAWIYMVSTMQLRMRMHVCFFGAHNAYSGWSWHMGCGASLL